MDEKRWIGFWEGTTYDYTIAEQFQDKQSAGSGAFVFLGHSNFLL